MGWEVISVLGLGTSVALGLAGYFAYLWIKEKARQAVAEETEKTIHEERRKVEERYKNRPDNLNDALDRL